jgi:hypothetical protein
MSGRRSQEASAIAGKGDERQSHQRRREAEAAQQRARIVQLNPVHVIGWPGSGSGSDARLSRSVARRVSDAAADPGERAGDGEADRQDRRTGCRRMRAGAPPRAAPAALGPRVERPAQRARQRRADPGRVTTSPVAIDQRGEPERERLEHLVGRQASSASPAAGAGRRRTRTGGRWSIRRRSRARRHDRCRRSRAASCSGRASGTRPPGPRTVRQKLPALPRGGPARQRVPVTVDHVGRALDVALDELLRAVAIEVVAVPSR